MRILCAVAACAWLVGCGRFPSPGAATPPLTATQVRALAKCQQTISKAQAKFARAKRTGLQKCAHGVLAAKVAFENGLSTQDRYDAGLERLRDGCTKSYLKIGEASTALVEAILAGCEPVAPLILGTYDGLRLQSSGAGVVTTLETLAGFVCTATEAAVDAELWLAMPRLMELLDALGADFVLESTALVGAGFPDVPLDSRCPTIESLAGLLPGP